MSGIAVAATLLLAPGLQYRQLDCSVAGRKLQLTELKLEPGQGLELRALPNPGAHPDARCHDGYGGPDLDALLAGKQSVPPDFEVLGATNGTVFRAVRGGYASNSFLWSKGSGLIAALRRGGGTELFIADPRGGHGATLTFVPCKGSGKSTTPAKEACAKLHLDGGTSKTFRGSGLVSLLQTHFPGMTLAVQSNMPLMDGKRDTQGHLNHWSRCPAPDPGTSGDWRCRPLPRTVLCAGSQGEISLFATSAAYPVDLADGLGIGGACGTGCVFFYNLDGGGSTQQAHLDPATRHYSTTGREIGTSQPGCSAYRPVDNYLVIGRPRQGG